MDPKDEEAIENPATENDDAATSDNQLQAEDNTPSLADAMWGENAGEDSVVAADGVTAEGEQDNKEEAEDGEGASTEDGEPKKEEAEAAADEDVSDDEIVKGLSEKAQKRFRELVNTNKDMEARLTGFQEMIVDAQVTPQDVVDLFSYGKAIRTGDFDTARAILAEQARQLELASGKPVDLGDPLADYPDLHNAVADMELTREHALELARTRRQNEAVQRQQEQTARRQQSQDQQQQATMQGFHDVQTLAASWAKTDLNWATKEPLLIKRAGAIQKAYPPSQWGEMMQLAYEEVTETMKALRPASQQRQPQPLRPNAMGGGAKAPDSLHEAMWGEPASS